MFDCSFYVYICKYESTNYVYTNWAVSFLTNQTYDSSTLVWKKAFVQMCRNTSDMIRGLQQNLSKKGDIHSR